jgi:hypothetical protein
MVSKGKKGLKEKKLPKYVRPHLGAFERTLGSAHTTVARSAQHTTDAAAARMPWSDAAALTHARSSTHASTVARKPEARSHAAAAGPSGYLRSNAGALRSNAPPCQP